MTSESYAMVSFLWRRWTTSKVGCRTATYSTSSGMKFGSSSVKTRQEWVHTYSTSPTTPPEGDNKDHARDISRIRLGFICDKARFYTCKGSFSKRVFSNHFCANRITSGVDPTQRIQVLILPDSISTVAHQWHFTQETPSISSGYIFLLFFQNSILSFKTLTPLFLIKRVVVMIKI
jgi:hypothetical protein